MCVFGAQFFMCGHFELLTDAIHTILCGGALSVNMVQYRDKAPAVCWPLPEEFGQYVGEHIGYYVFTQGGCSDPGCRFLGPEARQQTDSRAWYEFRHWGLVNDVFGIIRKYGDQAKGTIQSMLAKPDIIMKIQHPVLRRFFDEDIPWDLKLRYLLPKLVEADQLAGRLMVFLDNDAPRSFFRNTIDFIIRALERVKSKVNMLHELLWLLQEPKLDHISIAEIGSRFEYFPPPEALSASSSLLTSREVSELDPADYRSPILPSADSRSSSPTLPTSRTVSEFDPEDYLSPALARGDNQDALGHIEIVNALDARPSRQAPEAPEEELMERWLGRQLQAVLEEEAGSELQNACTPGRYHNPSLVIKTAAEEHGLPNPSTAKKVAFFGPDKTLSPLFDPDPLTRRERERLFEFNFEFLPSGMSSYARDLPLVSPTDVLQNAMFYETGIDQGDSEETLCRDDPSEEGKFRMPCVSCHGREWPVCVTWNCIRTQGQDERFRTVKPDEIKQESLAPEPFPKDEEMKEAPNQAMQDAPLLEPDYLMTGNGSYKRLAVQSTVRNVGPRNNVQDDQ